MTEERVTKPEKAPWDVLDDDDDDDGNPNETTTPFFVRNASIVRQKLDIS